MVGVATEWIRQQLIFSHQLMMKFVVTKGPQTVTEGSGLVAGAVRFVRKEPEFDTQNTY